MLCATAAWAQQADSTAFKGYLYNKEYDVYMRINFYEQDVIISWQDLLGPLPGFLAKHGTTYTWIVNAAEVEGNTARLEIINDYASEDLQATLKQTNDSTFILKQLEGSTIKFPEKSKWLKLPKSLTFIKQRER